ncbi:erythromycin esterase family protein [Salegentibacter mishustinae]|uniref:erythromycin esterase family protein n=1 Tax=Salegentibacter mishustinae TaxID=270918 RepID=UPI001CE0D827|nr:erythromycin esterase family protein [Salegentibacter mishustinae]UBZ08764.1 erythromycin esterase family protein [Salegentibacter mishustinae]
MKKIFTPFLILFLIIANAQEIKTIELQTPDSKDHSDLNFLKGELAGKDVVMLGEYTHMYGNIFEMKARIIEFLHAELGFNTIAIESPMYDVWKMNQTGFDPNQFNEAIWGVWGQNEEFQRLVKYIEKNNLKVIGFDSQVKNTSAFIEDFFDFCEENNIAFKLDGNDLGIIMEGVLDDFSYESYDIKFDRFEKEFQSIIKQIENLKDTEENYTWKHLTKNFLAAAREANTDTEPIIGAEMISGEQNIRDKEMADNLLSYISGNKNDKIAVWADNIHVMNDNSSIKKPIARDFVSMGNHIKKELGEKVYSLATIHANELFYENGKWVPTPVLEGSFEANLSKKNLPYQFISSNQEAMNKPFMTRLLSFEDFYEIRLDQVHDGYVFFENATLPKKEQDRITNKDSDQKKEGKTIPKIIKEDLITLKGQLLNIETNEPVAFANVILKEQEIYRVADENGFFELTVNNRMFNSAVAIISSMGFEDKSIRLDRLKDKTYLQSSFESLNEVVVTAHLTPGTVLKNAVKRKYENHTEEAFNYYRYSNAIINQNDVTKLNLDLITKNYDSGFSSEYRTTKEVDQIRWNKNLLEDKVKYTNQIYFNREDAIRYSNILHKRKYKKFDLEFVSSGLEENKGLYIIAFKTDRNRWNYTNRGYPTEYSGKVYINKESFAIIKVEENWKTHLKAEEVEKYYKDKRKYNGELSLIIKEENFSYYNKRYDGKYYPSRYFKRNYKEAALKNGETLNSVFEVDSFLYDYEFKDVKEIEYEYYGKEKMTVLSRVESNSEFWKSFEIENVIY